MRSMEYSSGDGRGNALKKYTGYASVVFDKAEKLPEPIAALEANPEVHKGVQATVAAHPGWFAFGEKRVAWAEAVSLAATSPATLPSSSSSSSSKRTDRLFPVAGTSTITSSNPIPSGPVSVSASGSGAAAEHSKGACAL